MEPHASDLGVSCDFKSSSVFKCSGNIGCFCLGLHITLHWFVFYCISIYILCICTLLVLCCCFTYICYYLSFAVVFLVFVACHLVSQILLLGVHRIKYTVP
jgi:hypothetical protein